MIMNLQGKLATMIIQKDIPYTWCTFLRTTVINKDVQRHLQTRMSIKSCTKAKHLPKFKYLGDKLEHTSFEKGFNFHALNSYNY